MTKQTEALKLALQYMDGTLVTDHLTGYERKRHVMEAVKQAIAEDFSGVEQPAQQKPVAWILKCGEQQELWWEKPPFGDAIALYTSPPAQQQEPVATLWQHGETGRIRITMPGDITDCDARWFKAADLYTSPPAQTDWEAVAADQAMTIALLRAEQPSQHQEPVGTVQCINGVTIGYLDVMQPVGTKLYTAPQPAQQEPWGACVHGRVFVGRLPDHVRKFSEDEGMPIQWLYTSPQPAQPAQPAQQEPVAKDDADIYEFWARNKETERQQKPMAYGKPWVGLDHDDIHALMNEYFYEGMQPSAIHFANFARAIEAKLKEKNT